MRPSPSIFWALLLLLALPTTSSAYGPRTIADSGDMVRWTMPVSVHLETDFDVRGKDVTSLIEDAFGQWEDLTDSDVVITRDTLGVAVDEENACDYLYGSTGCPDGPTSDGLNPLVIDEDGEITEMFFGTLNKFSVLGFATILFYNDSTGAAVKGEAVFNASCLNSVELAGCLTLQCSSFTDDDFTSFVVHEIGHFLGLNHTQVNLDAAEDDDASNDSVITTMYPIFSCGSGSYFKTPEQDDQVGVAMLYPASSFSSSTWTLTGTVFDEDGTTEFQCANVIARNEADEQLDAVSFVSGQLAEANSFDGSFQLQGLSPGASYTVEVEPIFADFTGSSGLSPCTGSSGDPNPPDFDPQTLSQTFTAAAGQTVTGVSFTLTNTEENVGLDGGDDDDAADDDDDGGGSSGGSGGCSLLP